MKYNTVKKLKKEKMTKGLALGKKARSLKVRANRRKAKAKS